LADARLALADPGAHRDDLPARLVPGDDGSLDAAADGEPSALGCPVGVKIAAAHARGLHGEHNLARIGKILERKLAIAEEHHAFHGQAPEVRSQLLKASERTRCEFRSISAFYTAAAHGEKATLASHPT
jgi:hypothetical protein